MWNRLPALLVLGGCYARPDFLPERPDPIPILPEGACALDRTEVVECTLDGDTFDVGACGDDFGERIRMLGIDAPEIAHSPDPADCYGPEAEDALRALLDGREVTLSFDVECTDVTASQRTLAYVWLEVEGEEPLFVNEWMLLNGYARRYEADWIEPLHYDEVFYDAELLAARGRVGLWGACIDAAP